MKIDAISYSFAIGTMTVFVHKNDKIQSIADIEITDRDLDEDEDSDYLKNLAEEIAFEQGYELEETR